MLMSPCYIFESNQTYKNTIYIHHMKFWYLSLKTKTHMKIKRFIGPVFTPPRSMTLYKVINGFKYNENFKFMFSKLANLPDVLGMPPSNDCLHQEMSIFYSGWMYNQKRKYNELNILFSFWWVWWYVHQTGTSGFIDKDWNLRWLCLVVLDGLR